MERLKRFLENPAVNIFIAVVLITSSLMEGWEDFSEDLDKFDLGVHHGILLFGIAMLLRGIVDALESIVRAHERRQKK